MAGDTLSDVLRAVRLRGAVFFYVHANDPWVAETPPGQEIIPAILPGVDHMMEFHVVARGSCWADRCCRLAAASVRRQGPRKR